MFVANIFMVSQSQLYLNFGLPPYLWPIWETCALIGIFMEEIFLPIFKSKSDGIHAITIGLKLKKKNQYLNNGVVLLFRVKNVRKI